MNMQKQKPIWSKILAMLCALALCISMVPAASAAPGGGSTTSNVSMVTMTFTGISEFWTYNTLKQISANGPETDSNVMYALTDNILTITPASSDNLPKSVMFYALAANEPTITGTGGSALPAGVTFSVVNDGSDEAPGQSWWIITLFFASTAPSKVTLNAEAVPTYTVTLKETTEGEKGYNLIKGSSDTVKKGENYQFYVIPKTGYQAPDVTVTRGGSDSEPVTPDDGLYTVSDIRSDITITIDEAQPQKYTVNFVPGDGYSFVTKDGSAITENTTTVDYNDNVSFKVDLNSNYSDSNVKVYANGTEIFKDTNGVYTINDIKVNQTVSVTGVEKNKYTVTLPKNTVGYYITTVDPTVVEAGGQFTFNVVVNPGYESNNIIVTINNTTTVDKNEDGFYTINNITDNTSISISGIVAAKYNVTTSGSNATVKVGETAIGENYQASYGNLTFTVTPDAGYKVDSVKVNGTSVTADSDGKYTIFVSNNVNIVVTTSPVVNVTLTTTVTATGNATYTIVVKTFPGEVTGDSADIFVVGYGTLYSNQSFDSQSLKNTILGLTLQNTLTQQQVSDDPVVYSYGQKVDFSLDQLRNTFSYTFNNSSSTNRFGAGWIKLSDDQNSWIVFSDTAQCQQSLI